MTTILALVSFGVLFAIFGLVARRFGCGECADRDGPARCGACPHRTNDSDPTREVER